MAAGMDEVLELARQGGLKQAAAYLRATAADYRQMAGQVDVPGRTHFSYTGALIQRGALLDKAALLEGQAKHIEGL